MKFVVSVWNEFGDENDFERAVPLKFNGKRKLNIGINNEIHLVFMSGFDKLSDDYVYSLRELGYIIYNVQNISELYLNHFKNLSRAYKDWGGIKFFGCMRFLVIEDLFKGEDLILFDADMVLNTTLDEISEIYSGKQSFLGTSSCFGSIPSKSKFFDIFREHILLLEKDPEDYVRNVIGMESASSYLDPHKSGGTDQAFIKHLIEKGLIDQVNVEETLKNLGYIGFPNWLLLNNDDGNQWEYKRCDGVDYLSEKKVLISHMSHDTCQVAGQYILLKEGFGVNNFEKMGGIPLPYGHYFENEDRERNYNFLAIIREFCRINKDCFDIDRYPFSRGNIVQYFYSKNDFTGLFNDKSWHKKGVFL
ncbi:hypothetical protein SAMN02982917_2193 [Azospirillum oryzae]|uniref:Uncharacterized protein n=1 Tax=Azospirillum oryzae TaxID=286727 RepID=A0A1X7F080_9PROT|nr:hypothetical protein [Azospirillum oryzae]SMF43113.1 hypothetical protein SAMN02982917_2193 [Azospirillum oryzae]